MSNQKNLHKGGFKYFPVDTDKSFPIGFGFGTLRVSSGLPDGSSSQVSHHLS